MASFRTVRGRRYKSSLGATFRTVRGRRYKSSLGAGKQVKSYARKIDKLSTVNTVIAIGGGGTVGFAAGSALSSALNLEETHAKLAKVGSTAIGALMGVNFMS